MPIRKIDSLTMFLLTVSPLTLLAEKANLTKTWTLKSKVQTLIRSSLVKAEISSISRALNRNVAETRKIADVAGKISIIPRSMLKMMKKLKITMMVQMAMI